MFLRKLSRYLLTSVVLGGLMSELGAEPQFEQADRTNEFPTTPAAETGGFYFLVEAKTDAQSVAAGVAKDYGLSLVASTRIASLGEFVFSAKFHNHDLQSTGRSAGAVKEVIAKLESDQRVASGGMIGHFNA